MTRREPENVLTPTAGCGGGGPTPETAARRGCASAVGTPGTVVIPIGVLVAILVGLLLVLSGCSGPTRTDARATTSTTTERANATTTTTTATATSGSSLAYLSEAQTANDMMTGVRLFVTPSVEEITDQSQTVFVGRVTGVDPPRPSSGPVSNEYVVFYVDREQVLKGQAPSSSAVAVGLLIGPSADPDPRPLSLGDEVLVFADRYDKSLTVAAGHLPGGYFLWGDYYGLWVKTGDHYVDLLVPDVSTTIDQVETIVGLTDTSTTLAPGFMSFDRTNSWFEDLLDSDAPQETIPYRIMEGGELGWLADAAPTIRIYRARGYELANGDVAVLFTYDRSSVPDEQARLAAEKRLRTLAADAYPDLSDVVSASTPAIEDYGFVIASRGHGSKLDSLARRARSGPPPGSG